MAFTRHLLKLRNNGNNNISTAKPNITAEIGLDHNIDNSPCDIISDCRNARSMPSPSTKPRINGAEG